MNLTEGTQKIREKRKKTRDERMRLDNTWEKSVYISLLFHTLKYCCKIK